MPLPRALQVSFPDHPYLFFSICMINRTPSGKVCLELGIDEMCEGVRLPKHLPPSAPAPFRGNESLEWALAPPMPPARPSGHGCRNCPHSTPRENSQFLCSGMETGQAGTEQRLCTIRAETSTGLKWKESRNQGKIHNSCALKWKLGSLEQIRYCAQSVLKNPLD